jgi:hypothetical protein
VVDEIKCVVDEIKEESIPAASGTSGIAPVDVELGKEALPALSR